MVTLVFTRVTSMRGLWMGMGAAAAAAVLAGTPAAAATVLNVNWTTDCSKSTCFNDNGVFTQTWSSAGANGPITIGQFLMDRGVLGALDDKTFRISFTVGGHEVGSWGAYTMGGIAGDELNFDGYDFVWNPEDGDLMLVLEIVQPPKAGAGGGGGMMSFASASDEDPPFVTLDDSQLGSLGGEETGSDGGEQPASDVRVAAIPEPASWALMIAGFGLGGAMLRRRRRLLSA